VEKKVTVLGLDGLSWRYLKKIVDAGIMPYTRALLQKSLNATLYSYPPTTPPSWTSIMTGVNPGKHGVMGFLHFDRAKCMEILTSSITVEHPRIYEMLAMNNIESVIINPVMNYPNIPLSKVRNIDHLFFTPKIVCHPRDMCKYVEKLPPRPKTKHCEEFVDFMYACVKSYLDITEDLLNRFNWRLFWLNINVPDGICHKCDFDIFGEIKPFEQKIYKLIDKLVKLLNEAADMFLIVSDHGFSNYDKLISINDALFNKGYIKLTTDEKRMLMSHSELAAKRKRDKYIKRLVIHPWLLKILTSKPLYSFSRSIKRLYERITGKKIKLTSNIDIVSSEAFMLEHFSYGVLVKNQNDIPMVLEILNKIEGIKWARKRENVFWGPYTSRALEIMFLPDLDRGYVHADAYIRGKIYTRGRFKGHHTDGVLLVNLRSTDKTLKPNNKQITLPNFIVAPLIMWFLDQPLPYDTDALPYLEKLVYEKNFSFRDYTSKWKILKRTMIIRSRLVH